MGILLSSTFSPSLPFWPKVRSAQPWGRSSSIGRADEAAVSPRAPRPLPDHQRQLGLPTPAPTRSRAARSDPDQVAKVAIARRTKPSTRPGHVKLTLTLDVPRELAERLSARAIREEKNLEGVVIGLLDRGSRDASQP